MRVEVAGNVRGGASICSVPSAVEAPLLPRFGEGRLQRRRRTPGCGELPAEIDRDDSGLRRAPDPADSPATRRPLTSASTPGCHMTRASGLDTLAIIFCHLMAAQQGVFLSSVVAASTTI